MGAWIVTMAVGDWLSVLARQVFPAVPLRGCSKANDKEKGSKANKAALRLARVQFMPVYMYGVRNVAEALLCNPGGNCSHARLRRVRL